MTNKEIIKKLNKLRLIEPNPQFIKTSRALILSYKPHGFIPYFNMPFLRLAGFFVVIIFIITALSLGFAGPKPALSSSFNARDLEKEFKNLTINTQLEEIKYREGVNQTVVSALNEIQNTNIQHLNNSLLESEKKGINLEESTNPEIDNLLNKVIF